MLPTLRLIVLTFFGAFILAAAAVHFAGTARVAPESLPSALARSEVQPALAGTIDWRHADAPVPAIFDLRFSADLSAIAAIPTRLTRPAEPQPAPPPEPTPAIEALPLPASEAPAPPPDVTPEPEPPLALVAPSDNVAPEPPIQNVAPASAPAAEPTPAPAAAVQPSAPASKPAARPAAIPKATPKKAAPPKAVARPVRRAAPKTTAATQPGLFGVFGNTGTPQ